MKHAQLDHTEGECLVKADSIKSKDDQEKTQRLLPWCAGNEPLHHVHHEATFRRQLYEEDKGQREQSNLNNPNFILNTYRKLIAYLSSANLGASYNAF